jgi:hypothetical protein
MHIAAVRVLQEVRPVHGGRLGVGSCRDEVVEREGVGDDVGRRCGGGAAWGRDRRRRGDGGRRCLEKKMSMGLWGRLEEDVGDRVETDGGEKFN